MCICVCQLIVCLFIYSFDFHGFDGIGGEREKGSRVLVLIMWIEITVWGKEREGEVDAIALFSGGA